MIVIRFFLLLVLCGERGSNIVLKVYCCLSILMQVFCSEDIMSCHPLSFQINYCV